MLKKLRNEIIYLLALRKIIPRLKRVNEVEDEIFPKQIAEHAKKTPKQVAVYFEDEKVTYQQLIFRANQYSHWFLKNGLKRGDVVALLMENRPEFLIVWIGITQIGGTVALINTNLKGHPLDHSLSISSAKHIIIGEEMVNNFHSVNDVIRENLLKIDLITEKLPELGKIDCACLLASRQPYKENEWNKYYEINSKQIFNKIFWSPDTNL